MSKLLGTAPFLQTLALKNRVHVHILKFPRGVEPLSSSKERQQEKFNSNMLIMLGLN